jgi:hypothetical protein
VFVSVALELTVDEYSLEELAAPMTGSSCTFSVNTSNSLGMPVSVRTVFTSINVDIHLTA